ncbi:hypothetical protein A2866_01695 [Candidatus Roizmanbacteria bacterium RIFCSPHIGHO2_01_FULL_39_8]|uniref:Glycosyl hydrolase family 13 catalytic domain-containing protein n=3 Tax=Candidatus Roizmaniibacteriota TaxID=1752723 RepID=A0A1F7GKL7_9BACT|nr:MAG: hypothetical protein A2866_01695 [Candidatus Roizmanbacteria bacterium RIFCSPHIGHO2_01_FULL_39_8]OGK25685.1 MAG: hypothetical protein A3C28_01465 [Candidatus Roizmanbacteria bacterium RIFCSPHIGHO2_02_FULL_39_9]
MIKDSLLQKLALLYGTQEATLVGSRLSKIVDEYKAKISYENTTLWDEKDIFFISYPDSFQEKDTATLQTLLKFLEVHLRGMLDGVHILPFFPYSSDRGFSITDYSQVKKEFGNWQDILNISSKYRLMADFVLNHVSVKHQWFQEFLKGNEAFKDYFISYKKEHIPTEYLKQVYRPRATPLLTPFQTSNEEKFVWTTFSVETTTDQADLNYKNPEVLLAIVKVLLQLLEKGVRIIRLDAVGFIWKEIGTNCFNRPQAHTIVQLFRDILNEVCPSALLLTQTSTSHENNISYFGDGVNESQIVYNFALPPLVLYSFYTSDVTRLSSWAKQLKTPSKSTTFLNFLAVHDGIGTAGVKEILSEEEIKFLCKQAVERGAMLSEKTLPTGEKAVYEINSTWWSVLHNQDEVFEVSIRKYLTSVAISFALAGIPILYYLSLFAEENDITDFQKTGVKREVNRKNFDFIALEKLLQNPGSRESLISHRVKELVEKRKNFSAFHPNAKQEILDLDKRILAILRTNDETKEQILCLHNVSKDKVQVACEGRTFSLKPYEFIWEKIS